MNIGAYGGMTASQFKSAMINTSGFAAQGTGTAKQFNNKMEEQLQPKQEWSEEDKDYFDAIIAKLEVTQDDAMLTDNQMDFLKSLRPQLKQE